MLDNKTGERFIPYVIEPSAGLDRGVIALLNEAYKKESLDNNKERIVLSLAPHLAPIKAAIIPLKKNNDALVIHEVWVAGNQRCRGTAGGFHHLHRSGLDHVPAGDYVVESLAHGVDCYDVPRRQLVQVVAVDFIDHRPAQVGGRVDPRSGRHILRELSEIGEHGFFGFPAEGDKPDIIIL